VKTSFEKLSLEIKDGKIIVEDKTGSKKYKQVFEFDEKNKFENLEYAKCWLWNMGKYNGHANEMMNKYNKKWYKKLKEETEYECSNDSYFNK
jgi:hypothetical protein